MSNSVINNLLAMNSNRQLGIVSNRKAKTTEKLSSGYRINRSADDAAGLAISEKMRRQIRGLSQASLNCQDGVSLVQTADGALAEVHDMLHRGTELSIQAANGTLTQQDREYIQLEIDGILKEIDSIKNRAEFNEIPLLMGGSGTGNYRIDTSDRVALMGKNMPDNITGSVLSTGYMSEVYENGGKKYPAGTIDFTSITEDNINELVGAGFNIDCSTCSHKYTFAFTDAENSSKETSGENFIYLISVKEITNGNDLVNRIVNFADNGVPGNHFTTLENKSGKLFMHENRDWPGENNLNYYQRNSKVLSGTAYDLSAMDALGAYDLLIQAGSEVGQQIGIRLPNIDTHLLNIYDVNVIPKGETHTVSSSSFNEATGQSTSTGGTYSYTTDGPSMAIEKFKKALEYVSNERSRMGAYQNRLEHTINNLNNVIENKTAAESQIRDTDMSTMMMQLTKDNILQQAGQAILAQANQSKQGILTLLQ